MNRRTLWQSIVWCAAAVGAAPAADVNTREPDGTSALHRAVDRDDLQLAKMLLKAGADAKAAKRYGVTPLSLACQRRRAMVSLCSMPEPTRTWRCRA